MPTIEITDEHSDRIETLREELTAAHAGPYASVDTRDTLAYLLDLADAVADPERAAVPAAVESDEIGAPAVDSTDEPAGDAPFDRDRARARLESRPRRHGDPDDADEMDLYEIAAAFDVTGRSDMTKAELVDAILEAAESLARDPFSWVDVDLTDGGIESDAVSGSAEETGDDAEENENDAEETGTDEVETENDEAAPGDDGGASQLNAMMSLLDTHDDKWREGDGDARYEVDLPDGNVETARTKDDVRALLFRNY